MRNISINILKILLFIVLIESRKIRKKKTNRISKCEKLITKYLQKTYNINEHCNFDNQNSNFNCNENIKQKLIELCKRDLLNWYKQVTKKSFDIENPKTFNEKIQWMKIYDNDPLKTQLSDKYLVREWIKEKIGEKYLIPLYGV